LEFEMTSRSIAEILGTLPLLHRQALEWFYVRTGEVHGWPGKVRFSAGETFLSSNPKGIFKPWWTKYALSVRQSLNGPYSDQIVRRSDGTWSYAYFQEGFDLAEALAKSTNRGLFACLRDEVPVGVFRQVSRNPHRYEILGLAVVATYDGGFFFLEGVSRDGCVRRSDTATEMDFLTRGVDVFIDAQPTPSLTALPSLLDRQRAFVDILRRRGQHAFREQLMHAYNGRCAISRYDAPDALEAAHIVPYARSGLTTASNGLLLRADVHTLFDLGLVAVRPDSFQVVLSDRLQGTRYEALQGCSVSQPSEAPLRPDPVALEQHATWARLY
jgi:putative restriction endonuclease